MSFDISFLCFDHGSPAAFARTKHLAFDHCGICNEKNADTFWPSPTSRWAHFVCMNQIASAETELLKTINGLFTDNKQRQNFLRYHANKAVIEKCQPSSIAKFAEENGIKAVTELFNTVGIEAAKKLAYEMRDRDCCNELKIARAAAPLVEFGFVSARL